MFSSRRAATWARRTLEGRMRFVTLNLDVQDARVVRRAVAGAIGRCGCQRGDDGGSCPSCEALEAVLADLDRVLSGPGARRTGSGPSYGTAPLRPSGAVALPAAAGAAGDRLRLLPRLGDA
jgi:hypothetical protein